MHDFLPYFGKYTMNQYPPAVDRKYVKVDPYRGYGVGLYRAPENDPAFELNGLPICELFFVLDELGENPMPVDVPFTSVFHAYAAIDLFIRYDTPEWRAVYPGKSLWTFVQENCGAGMKYVQVMDFLREVHHRVLSFSPGDPDFGDDPVEWRETTAEFMENFLAEMRK